MYIYTFYRMSQWSTEIKQIASDLPAEEVKKTYLDNNWELATEFKLDKEFSKSISKNNYLWELEIENPNYEG